MMRHAHALAAVLALPLALVGAPRDAHAMSDDALGTAAVACFVADVGFATASTVYVAEGKLPDKGYAAVEGVVGLPQAGIGMVLVGAVAAHEKHTVVTPLAVALATVPAFMTVHGAWGLATDRADPGALYGVSWATAADGVLTVADVGSGTSLNRSLGVLEVAATAPQVVVASTQAASTTAGSRVGWIALDAWAGLLLLHGVVAVVAGDDESSFSTPPPATPPPPPPPAEPPPSGPLAPDDPSPRAPPPPSPSSPAPSPSPSPSPSSRSPIVPGSIGVAPVAVAGGAGLALHGLLF